MSTDIGDSCEVRFTGADLMAMCSMLVVSVSGEGRGVGEGLGGGGGGRSLPPPEHLSAACKPRGTTCAKGVGEEHSATKTPADVMDTLRCQDGEQKS